MRGKKAMKPPWAVFGSCAAGLLLPKSLASHGKTIARMVKIYYLPSPTFLFALLASRTDAGDKCTKTHAAHKWLIAHFIMRASAESNPNKGRRCNAFHWRLQWGSLWLPEGKPTLCPRHIYSRVGKNILWIILLLPFPITKWRPSKP